RPDKAALRVMTTTSAAVKTGGPSGEPRSSATAGSHKAASGIASAGRSFCGMVSRSLVDTVLLGSGTGARNFIEHPVRAHEHHAIRALLALQEPRLCAGDRDFPACLRRHNEDQQPREVGLVKRARAVAPNLSQSAHGVRCEHRVEQSFGIQSKASHLLWILRQIDDVFVMDVRY